MRTFKAGSVVAAALAIGLGTVTAIGQSSTGAVETHVAAAKKAAGQEWAGVFNTTCNAAVPPATPAARTAPAAPRPAGPPERSTWHAEPVKVFDNLYFLGQTDTPSGRSRRRKASSSSTPSSTTRSKTKSSGE